MELDGKSVYDVWDIDSVSKLTPSFANTFWNAGFEDINEPNEAGLTPFLQSWMCANFEMVAWFNEKGVSLASKHRGAPLTALHIYAARISYTVDLSSHVADDLHTDKHYMARAQAEIGFPRDECTCLCSPRGCTPAKFLFKTVYPNYMSRKSRFQKWVQNVAPEASSLQEYTYEFTRGLLFEFLGGKHTCCHITRDGHVSSAYEPGPPTRFGEPTDMWIGRLDKICNSYRDYVLYCLDGIPVPPKAARQFSEDAEEFGKILDSLMSHYEEIPPPGTMPPEEQPFRYLNWLIAEQHLKVDGAVECNHSIDLDGNCRI